MVSKSTNQKSKISKSYKMRQIRIFLLIILYNDVGDITSDENGPIGHQLFVTNIDIALLIYYAHFSTTVTK